MSEHRFEVEGGKSLRLKTAGKYCDRDIVVSGKGGDNGGNLLKQLFTEGGEITAEDWGSLNLATANQYTPLIISDTIHKKITFSDSQTSFIGFKNNKNLEEYDSGANMFARVMNTNATNNVFTDCQKLKTLRLGAECLPFFHNGYADTLNLDTVYYAGTIDKWAGTVRGNSNAVPFLYPDCGYLYINNQLVTEANITTATTIQVNAFYKQKNLTKATLGESVKTIAAKAFRYSGITTLILKGDTVKTLSNITAFEYSPIQDGTGSIYIQPETVDEATLVAEYKAATNWSTFEGQIKPFSEYTGG